MKLIGAFIWGGVLGAAATLLHSAYFPAGLMLALLGSGVGIWILGRAWGLRRYKVLASAGWILVTLRAGTPGIGDELLIQGNFVGNALVVCGFVMLLFVVSARV